MSAEMKVQPGDGAVRADEGVLVRIAIGFTLWAERWFPDAFAGPMGSLIRAVEQGGEGQQRAAARCAA